MQPIIIDGCFCWLHIQPDSLGGDTAVLLCPGIRSDALTGYRSFRLLADAMAAAGYPTLRLQYPDTGNSAGLSSTEHWEAWQHSIHRAADWLRDRCGVQHIVLCGLRFGAMLAAAVSAQRSDVAGLILLAPILRGRTYIRQLIIEANLPSIPGKDGFVIGEIALSAETVRRISQAELRHMLPPRGCQVAIYAQSPSPALSECVQQWCTRGVEVACNDFNGLESMLRPTFMNHEPPLTMVRLLDWLSQAIPPSRLASGHPAPVPTVELRTAAWAETPLNFGADHALFGILCRPSKSDLAGIVVVIASTSGDPHCAPVAVDLARRLAVAGIASLRLDFAGLGDSIAPGNHPTHIFEANRLADVSAAIDPLASLGYRRFAIQGLCSGAYHAFQAAVGEERIGLVLLINLPLFQWRPGDAVELLGLEVQTPTRLLQMLTSKMTWRNVMRGQISLRRRLAWPRRWIAGRIESWQSAVSRALGFRAPLNAAQDALNRLVQHASVLMLFAQNDPGIMIAAESLGLDSLPAGVTMETLPGLDHSLTGAEMRRVVAQRLIEALRQIEPSVARSRPLATTSVETQRRGRIVAELHDIIDSQ